MSARCRFLESALARRACGLAAIVLALSGPARPADADPARQVALLDGFLFLAADDTYLIGTRIARWEGGVRIDSRLRADRAYLEALVERISRSGALGARRIEVLAGSPLLPGSPECEFSPSRSEVVIDTGCGHYEHHTESGPLAGLERYWAHATATGCYAEAGVAYKDRDHVIRHAKVLARRGLDDDARRDCLFRGLMIALGLKLSERLAFRSGVLSSAERKDALDALGLLYDPRLRPGMTREQALRALAR